MKKPEKKETILRVDNEHDFTLNCGYNQAWDDWEAYHEEIRQELLWWQNLLRGHHNNKTCPNLKTYIEQLKTTVERLPSEEEIRELIINRNVCLRCGHPDVNAGELAKTIHKRIGGQ